MSTTHQLDEVEAYVAEVRERLTGLPNEECAELLEDVTAHVREVANEHGADQLRERLGSPEQFGDELRASAGFTPVDAPRGGAAITSRVGSTLKGFRETAVVRRVVAEWPRLEPAWWLLRGVAVVWLIVSFSETDPTLIPRIGSGGHALGLAALVAGAVVSFGLGSRRPATQSVGVKRVRVVAEVALALFAITHVTQVPESHVVFYDSGGQASPDACLRDSAGRAIGNLFAFDPAGKAISQFFLVDQAGRPIDNLCPDQVETSDGFDPPQTQYAHDANGAPVYNVFPRAQQRVVIDPVTGVKTAPTPVPPPAVVFPQVVPPSTDASTSPTTTP